MEAGHLNTQSKEKRIEFTITETTKQGFCKSIITNLPNGDDSK